MRRKVHTVRLETPSFLAANIPTDDFDRLVDEGYDDILVITPRGRYVASIDEWLDYSYIDLDSDTEIRVMHRSYMGLV